MRRRSFLRSAAALPLAGINPMAFANMPGTPATEEAALIPSGKDRLGEVHSRGYSSILFKVLPRETSNGLFVMSTSTSSTAALRCTSIFIRKSIFT